MSACGCNSTSFQRRERVNYGEREIVFRQPLERREVFIAGRPRYVATRPTRWTGWVDRDNDYPIATPFGNRSNISGGFVEAGYVRGPNGGFAEAGYVDFEGY